MAAVERTPPLTKQERAAAKVATFKAEQVRLKDEAAKRRAASAARTKRGGITPVDRAWSVGRGGSGRQGQR
jgi:hypothetical protein